MTNTSLVIFMAAIMVVGVLGTNFVPDADALKSKNSASGNTDICGLVLCSDYQGGKAAYEAEWVSMYRTAELISQEIVHETMDKHHVPVSAHNADKEFPAKLDVFIHKFELDKISADETLEGIKETYHQYTDAKISNDIIAGVGDKLSLYKKGTLNAEEAVESIHLTAEPQNVNPEYQAALDEVIHKFELDKISADEAINGIKEAHYGFVDLYITSDLIEAVEVTIGHIDSGKLSGGEAVESIHLTAEPQNVDPEFIAALEESIYQFELNEISSDEAIEGIKETHAGFVGLTITSDLIEDVGVQLVLYEGGKVSSDYLLEEIHEVIEEAEMAALVESSNGGAPVMKELPPNTVDIPAGTGVPGCEADNWCYMNADYAAHVGDTITWQNSDTLPHTVTSGSGNADAVGLDVPNGFDSGFMSAGDTFVNTFAVAGVYDYYCQLHPWMEGSVTVE